MRIPWRGLSLALPASAGYYAAGYSSGNTGYAPIRTKEWVDQQMQASKTIEHLKHDSKFQQLTQSPQIATLQGYDGAVSETTLSFRDKSDPSHTLTFVHCGPHTVGFPFLVHGGVLGTLLRQSAELALGDDGKGTLNIKYRNPTQIDKLLKIESFGDKNALSMYISPADSDRLLVEATYTR